MSQLLVPSRSSVLKFACYEREFHQLARVRLSTESGHEVFQAVINQATAVHYHFPCFALSLFITERQWIKNISHAD